MKLKDFFAFKDWLSYRQKVGLLVIAGVVCCLGGLFMKVLRHFTRINNYYAIKRSEYLEVSYNLRIFAPKSMFNE